MTHLYTYICLIATATQFSRFAKYCSLDVLQKTHALVYVPYVAHASGVKVLSRDLQHLNVCPVEMLSDGADFFAEDPNKVGVCRRDKTNTVAAVNALIP